MEQSFEESGYIYCLSNESYKDTYKIGFTKNDPLTRMVQLNTTGLLYPFKLEFAKQVKNYQEKEKKLHNIFDKYRVNKNREFFKIELKEIKQLFDLIDGKWYKPDEVKNTEKKETNEVKPEETKKAEKKETKEDKPKEVKKNEKKEDNADEVKKTEKKETKYSSTQCIEVYIQVKKQTSNIDTKMKSKEPKIEEVKKDLQKPYSDNNTKQTFFNKNRFKTPQEIYDKYIKNIKKNNSNQIITHCSRCFDKFEKSFMVIRCIHDDICKHCTSFLRECPICKSPYN